MKTHEIITAHKLWTRLNTSERAAFLANFGQGVGATWAETASEQGMPDDEWKTAARRRLRFWTEERSFCETGLLKDERGDRTLACQRSP